MHVFFSYQQHQVYENWALGELSANEKDEIQANYEKSLIDTLEKNQRTNSLHLYGSFWMTLWRSLMRSACRFHLADVLPTFSEGLQTLVDVRKLQRSLFIHLFLFLIAHFSKKQDSFTKCFSSHKYVNWNWNIYLFPVWLLGVCVRYCVLFPLRLLCLIAGSSFVFTLFPIVSIFAPGKAARERYQVRHEIMQ